MVGSIILGKIVYKGPSMDELNRYYYNKHTKHLYTDQQETHPFLCHAEAEPLVFSNSNECLEYLTEQSIEGIVVYKLFG